MAVFSFIKRGRQAAKEHSVKQAEKEKQEQQKTPYKHIPKHAAIDALSGGPATWRDVDRPKILEQNRRRSAMTANGVGMGGMMNPVHQGMPRTNSALSHVSYPAAYANPVVHFPRAYSYSSMPAPGWNNQGGEVSYAPLMTSANSAKGKEVERVMVDSGRASRASSYGSLGPSPLKDVAVSTVGSSSNSTSSQDDLEMKPVKHASSNPVNDTPPTKPAAEPESLHRLHPSHARRTSGSNQFRSSVPSPRSGASRNSSSASLPTHQIPPVPSLPPMQVGTALSSPIPGSSSSSTSSSITISPSVAKAPVPVPVPVPVPGPIVGQESEAEEPAGPIGVATTSPLTQNSRRASKYTRFSELETINSEISPDVQNLGSTLVGQPEKKRPISTVAALPTTFDESVLSATRQQPIELPPPRTGKLSKIPSAGTKPAKKNRWSLRSSKNTAVAV